MGACRAAGYAATGLHPARRWLPMAGAVAAIFDGTDGRGPEAAPLGRLAAALGGAPISALLDFPRAEDRDRVLACGAAAVLSKPLLLEDLWWQLDHLHEE